MKKLAFIKFFMYNTCVYLVKTNKRYVMDRQNTNSKQAVQRQIRVPQREAYSPSVPSREVLQSANTSVKVVAEQPANQLPTFQPRPTIAKPASPAPRVTFEQVLGSAHAQQPVAPGGQAIAPAAMPIKVVNPAAAQLQKSIKQSAVALRPVSTKIKNNPLISKVQSMLPAEVSVRPNDLVRYGVVALCLFVAGFLAYDTWQTNQQIQRVFSPEASASEVITESEESAGNGEGSYTVAPEMPRSLTIPSIGVNAYVVNIGLTSDNRVDIPTSNNDVGWFNGSVKPGEPGAAFMTGHYNAGGYSVFNELANVGIGDKVNVERGDGSWINYEVYDKETIYVGDVNMSSLMVNTGGTNEALNLMTCAGSFNGYDFSHRTIVYTKRV